MLPILLNHDWNHPIGHIEQVGHKFLVNFKEPYFVTREMFFDIFDCGAIVEFTECGEFVTSATVLEFSVDTSIAG